MSFRAEQIPSLLGEGLAQFSVNSAARERFVSCVTVVSSVPELADCRSGELVLLASGASLERCALELVEGRTTERVTAVLLPADGLTDSAYGRLAGTARQGDVALGVLGHEIDPRRAANILSRALTSTLLETALTRLHAVDTLQGVAETLGRLVGNSITIETPNHDLLASSATGSDVDRNREETILHRHGSGKVMGSPEFDAFMAGVRASDRPLHLRPYPEYDFAGRVAMRVAAHGEIFGVIWVTDTARPLGENDYAVIKQAADAAAALFLRERASRQREAEVRSEFLEDVVQGRITSIENVRTVARTIGWNIDRAQQTMVVAIDQFEDFRLRHSGRGGVALQRIRDRLMEIVRLDVLAADPEAVVGMRSTGVVVLLAAGEGNDASRKATTIHQADGIAKHVATFLAGVTVTVGVGRDAKSIEHLAESFRQAELAVQLGTSLWGGNRAVHYDDLGVHRVLFALREYEGMVPPALQQLLAYDEQHGTEYVRTMAVYLRWMGKLRAAAADLGVHRNTLEYRIGRITELSGMDLGDPDNRLALELGIRILELGPQAGEAHP